MKIYSLIFILMCLDFSCVQYKIRRIPYNYESVSELYVYQVILLKKNRSKDTIKFQVKVLNEFATSHLIYLRSLNTNLVNKTLNRETKPIDFPLRDSVIEIKCPKGNSTFIPAIGDTAYFFSPLLGKKEKVYRSNWITGIKDSLTRFNFVKVTRYEKIIKDTALNKD